MSAASAKKPSLRQADGDMSATEFAEEDATSQHPNDPQSLIEDAMGSHLDLMLDIIMQIREDEAFARSIYANCPRLQHLLDQHPDLRPIFDDPKMVRLNFEDVYRKAGGILPEDTPTIKQRALKVVGRIVRHPLFKVLRFLLVIKKIYNCIVGGGLSCVRGALCALFSDGGTAAAAAGANEDVVGDGDGADINPENEVCREQLMSCADYMEEPDVQEKMQNILTQNPDQLAEAIENDPELRALRDSSPMCAELMSDPETMRILVDPDNLRALGECPDLVQQDFANPNWTPPDVDSVPFDDGVDVDQTETSGGVGEETTDNAPGQEELSPVEEFELGEIEEAPDADQTDVSGIEDYDEEGLFEASGENEGNILEEYELGEADQDNTSARKAGARRAGGSKRDNNEKESEKRTFFQGIAMGVGDLLAAELMGTAVSEIMGGGDDELDQLAQQAEEQADATAGHAETAAVSLDDAAKFAASDEFAGQLEETMDNMEETHQDAQASPVQSEQGRSAAQSDNASLEVHHEQRKFAALSGAIGYFAASLTSAAKETLLAQALGDDLAEHLVAKMEEENDEGEDDSNDTGMNKDGSRQSGKR